MDGFLYLRLFITVVRLQAQAAVLQTAKAAYLQALKASLPILDVSDTIKLS
jgi:hypothetical protein